MKIRRISPNRHESYLAIYSSEFDSDGEVEIIIGDYAEQEKNETTLVMYLDRASVAKLSDKLVALLTGPSSKLATYTVEE